LLLELLLFMLLFLAAAAAAHLVEPQLLVMALVQAVEVAENTPLAEPQEEAMAVVVVVVQAVMVQVLPLLELLIPVAGVVAPVAPVPDRPVVYKVVMVDQEWLLLGILLTQAV
jgi:hypothetical protein